MGGGLPGGGGGAVEVSGGEAGGDAERTAGFEHERGDVAAGASLFFEGLAGRLGSLFGATVIGDGLEEKLVEMIEERFGIAVVGGEETVPAKEILDEIGILTIRGGAIGGGDSGFERVVHNGKGDGDSGRRSLSGEARMPKELNVGLDREGIGGLEEIDERDGVAENIAGPGDVVFWGDAKLELFDTQIVAFTRTDEEAVLTETNGLGVAISRRVEDAESGIHGSIRIEGDACRREVGGGERLESRVGVGARDGDLSALHPAEDGGDGGIRGIASGADADDTVEGSEPRGVEENPAVADVGFEESMEIRRVEAKGIGGDVASGDGERAAECDAEVSKISADAGALDDSIVGGGGGIGGAREVVGVALYPVSDGDDFFIGVLDIAELVPSEASELVGLAVT